MGKTQVYFLTKRCRRFLNFLLSVSWPQYVLLKLQVSRAGPLNTTKARVLWNKFLNIGRERVGSEIVYNNNNSILQGCMIATGYFILINSIK